MSPISPGAEWGGRGVLPVDAPLVSTDQELASLVAAGEPGRTAPIVGLSGGDLCATLGGRGDVAARRGQTVSLLPVDVGEARLDGEAHLFAAHLLARGRFWSGRGAAVMNAERLGQWILAPRAHPGDGLFDIVEGALPLRQRLQARRRARTGEHVPHPALQVRRARTISLSFDRPRLVIIDHRAIGRFSAVDVEIRPAAVTVAV